MWYIMGVEIFPEDPIIKIRKSCTTKKRCGKKHIILGWGDMFYNITTEKLTFGDVITLFWFVEGITPGTIRYNSQTMIRFILLYYFILGPLVFHDNNSVSWKGILLEIHILLSLPFYFILQARAQIWGSVHSEVVLVLENVPLIIKTIVLDLFSNWLVLLAVVFQLIKICYWFCSSLLSFLDLLKMALTI